MFIGESCECQPETQLMISTVNGDLFYSKFHSGTETISKYAPLYQVLW